MMLIHVAKMLYVAMATFRVFYRQTIDFLNIRKNPEKFDLESKIEIKSRATRRFPFIGF